MWGRKRGRARAGGNVTAVAQWKPVVTTLVQLRGDMFKGVPFKKRPMKAAGAIPDTCTNQHIRAAGKTCLAMLKQTAIRYTVCKDKHTRVAVGRNDMDTSA